jgi:hypothetical protein
MANQQDNGIVPLDANITITSNSSTNQDFLLQYQIEYPPFQCQNLGPNFIHLTVKNEQGEKLFFKLKTNKPLRKLMHIYCSLYCLDFERARFSLNGTNLQEGKSPNDLEMRDGDQIDFVHPQQVHSSSQCIIIKQDFPPMDFRIFEN